MKKIYKALDIVYNKITKEDYEILRRKYCGAKPCLNTENDVQRRLEESLNEMEDLPIFLQNLLLGYEVLKRESTEKQKKQKKNIRRLREDVYWLRRDLSRYKGM